MATLLLVVIYIAFISLGLPDAVLGAGWPLMHLGLGVPLGHAGIPQMITSIGTIVSSIFSTRVIKKLGTGKVTAISVGLTAVALLGFGLTPSFWFLILFSVPLGLGAGAIDAGLNAYVASHYEARHMNWLHSFWGIGALMGPLLLSAMLANGLSWRSGYISIALVQFVLVLALILALPLWNKVKARKESLEPIEVQAGPAEDGINRESIFYPIRVRGTKLALSTFFFYCGIEASMGLWGGSYLHRVEGMDVAAAARWVSFFYGGITLGRFLAGFITEKINNDNLVRIGGLTVLVGVLLLLLPFPLPLKLTGFLAIGFGCAPIFPAMLHETPLRFGPADAQAIMGFQMATAYVGTTFLPPLFGLVASASKLWLLPFFLLVYILFLILSSERLRRIRWKTAGAGQEGTDV